MRNQDMPPIQHLLSDPEPLIPEGTYQFKILKWETRVMFAKASKLHITFMISEGEYAGVKLPYYCNVKRFIGKPKTKGRFVVGKKSKFARQFYTVMESMKEPTNKLRLDRLPLSKLNHIKANVRTVKVAENKPIPKSLQYSVVKEMIGKY